MDKNLSKEATEIIKKLEENKNNSFSQENIDSYQMEELKLTNRKRILVVDDDEKIVNVIVMILNKKMNGFEVFSASDGFQAGHAIYDFKPHLVVLDIKLPGIDGCRICSIIKKMNSSIKVLAVTGFDTSENRRKIMMSGADAYIAKPFMVDDIVDSVKRMLK